MDEREAEQFLKGLMERCGKATPEEKERGQRLAQRFANSRLAYNMRKRCAEAHGTPRGL